MNFITFVLSKQSIKSAVFSSKKIINHLDNPTFEAEFLLAAILEKDASYLRAHPEELLTVAQKEQFFRYLKKRAKNIPAAYILGYKNWNDLKITVNQHTLIPRDETEILIDHIKNFDRNFTPTKILDIGTGSGCITLALTKLFADAKFCALDISGMALKVAKKNIRALASFPNNISFWQSNLLDGILPNQSYQIIVANLPYVPTSIQITKEVSTEPADAIFSGTDGLDLIRELAQQIQSKEIKFQELWLEFLPQSAPEIQKIFENYDVTLKNDISGQPFFAVIQPKK